LPAGTSAADATSAGVDATRPLSARNEAAARASLARAARAALARYPSTLKQTERALADATAAAAAADAGADAAASERLAAALTVRAGEQRALAAVLRAAADGSGDDAAQPRRADADARAALRDSSLL
jgi:hypothetical protein